jgi:glucose-6-phosphate 1-epimerase
MSDSRLKPRVGTVGGSDFTAYDHGAQLASWNLAAQPVLYLSRRATFQPDSSIRGGVPICWPWFGPGRGRPHSPSHGFARISPWRLVSETVTGSAAQLAWELDSDDVAGQPGRDLWPHPFQARSEIVVGDTAQVRLTVVNTGDRTLDYEVALHTYLVVGDVARVHLSGLDGADWFDKVDGGTHRQDGDLRITGETDRVYHSAGPVHVHDPVLDRVITVTKEGSPDTIVWNPWAHKGQDIGDMEPQDWSRMLCVEAGSVLENAVRLEPGGSHSITTTISVSRR